MHAKWWLVSSRMAMVGVAVLASRTPWRWGSGSVMCEGFAFYSFFCA